MNSIFDSYSCHGKYIIHLLRRSHVHKTIMTADKQRIKEISFLHDFLFDYGDNESSMKSSLIFSTHLPKIQRYVFYISSKISCTWRTFSKYDCQSREKYLSFLFSNDKQQVRCLTHIRERKKKGKKEAFAHKILYGFNMIGIINFKLLFSKISAEDCTEKQSTCS